MLLPRPLVPPAHSVFALLDGVGVFPRLVVWAAVSVFCAPAALSVRFGRRPHPSLLFSRPVYHGVAWYMLALASWEYNLPPARGWMGSTRRIDILQRRHCPRVVSASLFARLGPGCWEASAALRALTFAVLWRAGAIGFARERGHGGVALTVALGAVGSMAAQSSAVAALWSVWCWLFERLAHGAVCAHSF